jgi:hypothetical protein
MKRRLVLALVLAACGSKSDDCQKFVDKMLPAMKAIAPGESATDGDKTKILAMCRKDPAKLLSDPAAKCVLAADGDDAVKQCVAKEFGDYTAKSKVTEAGSVLNQIGKGAKRVYGETGAFPIGTAKLLPANNASGDRGGGCCGGKSDGQKVDNKCPVSKDWAGDPVWSALGFSVDERSAYRYQYDSKDGKTFTATAVGDVDCDGQPATFTLTGKLDPAGNPTMDLVKPPAGTF